jgi:hypothetical protein
MGVAVFAEGTQAREVTRHLLRWVATLAAEAFPAEASPGVLVGFRAAVAEWAGVAAVFLAAAVAVAADKPACWTSA